MPSTASCRNRYTVYYNTSSQTFVNSCVHASLSIHCDLLTVGNCPDQICVTRAVTITRGKMMINKYSKIVLFLLVPRRIVGSWPKSLHFLSRSLNSSWILPFTQVLCSLWLRAPAPFLALVLSPCCGDTADLDLAWDQSPLCCHYHCCHLLALAQSFLSCHCSSCPPLWPSSQRAFFLLVSLFDS